MTGAFTTVDLSQLTSPDVVETIDYEQILSDMISDLRARDPAFTALVESDPAYKILEVAAYREMILRQRVNDAARAVMLAFASGADLDQIGANYDVGRLLIDPGNPNAIPPIPPTFESDEDFRKRIQLSPEGYTTAGSEGSYVFYSLGADGDVKDASAVSPNPGEVVVYVLSRTGDGTPSPALLSSVEGVLNAEFIRPLTDMVTVDSPSIINYTVEAELVVLPGPDAEVVRQSAFDEITRYTQEQHRIGYDVTLSGVYAALHRPGVQRVNLTSPADNLIVDNTEAAFCTSIIVTLADMPDV